MLNQYIPDVVSPPGETLEEILEERHLTQAELAERIGRPRKTINEIIQGKAAITPETAIQLERVLNTPAQFWLLREQHYREYLARLNDQQQLESQLDWLKEIPLKQMQKLGWIQKYDDDVEQLREVLTFFGIASPREHEVLTTVFRKSPALQSDEMALAAWLRQGERLAQHIKTPPFDEVTFRAILQEVRRLSQSTPATFIKELPRLCANAGVVVVVVPELSHTHVCGAARWIDAQRPLIQLSLRYKSDDQFWFSFFHEAGHILLHGKRDAHIDEEKTATDKKETEANQFASNQLIPPAALRQFLQKRGNAPFSKAEVTRFAKEIEVAPGIIVGRLQHERKLAYTHLNELKQSLAELSVD